MALTINGEEWKYLGVLNSCIQLVLTMLMGGLAGYWNILNADTFVPQATTWVFYVALPGLILNGLGININLYNDKYLWEYILAFLILRVLALAFAMALVMCSPSQRQKGIGQVAVLWLAMTWISTVILGVPIASATFGNPTLGAQYGILAGISSFIFQLPLLLFFLECQRLEDELVATNAAVAPDVERANGENQDIVDVDTVEIANEDKSNEEKSNELNDSSNRRVALWHFFGRSDAWKKIGFQVLHNPVLWSIAGGFLLTITTLGPTYLNEKSAKFIPGLNWIPLTLAWFGDTLSPVALLSMGVWMQGQGSQLFRISNVAAAGFMISKLVVVPLVMLGLAKLFHLANEPGRAAVLIAALPISMASFPLADRYGIGEAVMAENVALGNLLILPTVILWNIALDALGVFPITQS